MTLEEKARAYFQYKAQGDPRCFILVSMLAAMFNMPIERIEDMIMKIVENSE